MRGRRGFTLIELVVLVGITAIFIGFLLPALQQTRANAYLQDCASNLKQIGAATSNYAVDYNGYLPAWREQNNIYMRDAGGFMLNFGSTWAQDVNALPNNIRPPGTSLDNGSDLLRFNILGYLGQWNWVVQGYQIPHSMNVLRYGAGSAVNNLRGNPYVQSDTSYFLQRWCPGQQGNLSDFGSACGSDYLYNPHWAYLNVAVWAASPRNPAPNSNSEPGGGTLSNQPYTGWYPKLAQYPSNAALASDAIFGLNSINHVVQKGKSAEFNLLYPDGHVQTVMDSFVIASMFSSAGVYDRAAVYGGGQGTVEAAQSPYVSPVTGNTQAVQQVSRGAFLNAETNQAWLMDDYLDILETEADQRNPVTQDNFTGAIPRTTLHGNPLPLRFREQFIKGWDSASPTSNAGNIAIVNYF